MSVFDSIDSVFGADFANGPTVNPQYQPLQPKREWAGLTDEEIDGLVKNTRWHELIKATEAKLKQKNGYAEENA